AGRERAGAGGDGIDVNGAGAAMRDAADVFGAGQADILPAPPGPPRVWDSIDVMILAIDIEANHSRTSPGEIFPVSTSEDRVIQSGCETVIRLFQINNRAGGLFRARSSRADWDISWGREPRFWSAARNCL